MNLRTSLLLSVGAKSLSSALTIYVVYVARLRPELNPFTSPAAQVWGATFVVLFYVLLAAWRQAYNRRTKAGARIRWREASERVYTIVLYGFPILLMADAGSDLLVSLAALGAF